MIPLGDASRRLRSIPIVTILIIAANILVFLEELRAGERFITRWAVVPAQVAAGHNLITVITAMFLHAGIVHLVGNMVFLLAFGPQLEDVMGAIPYAVFYLLGGLAATAAQVAVDPHLSIPSLGASGAIAAVMGGFLITFPEDRIRTLIVIVIFINVAFIPAIVLIGIWFLIQLFNAFGALTELQTGGVAYMAHVGGFIFGLIAARFFESARLRVLKGLAR